MPCPLSYIRLVLKDIPFFLPISENTVLLPSVSFITTGKDTKRKGVKYSPHAFSYLTDSFQNYSTQLPLRSAPSRGRRLAQHDLEFYGTDISIHAVARTATNGLLAGTPAGGDFNPRRRRDGDRTDFKRSGPGSDFNPRRRRDGDPVAAGCPSTICISIHAVAGTATVVSLIIKVL